MSIETIIFIAAFFVGGFLVQYLTRRGQDRGEQHRDSDHDNTEAPARRRPRRNWSAKLPVPFPVTVALIAISVVVALWSGLGESRAALSSLFISDPFHSGLSDVMSGEVWRLFTPIFIHFGPMHIIFNMIMLWQIGRVVEYAKGEVFFLSFVLGVGAVSNLAQYLIDGSPFFGGMSGVLYGLFGYLWMQGRTNPAFEFRLSQNSINILLVWYALCWTGYLGNIANWAHTGGLVMGVALGFHMAGQRR